MNIQNIKKRDGSVTPFTQSKIVSAVFRAFNTTGEGSDSQAIHIAQQVAQELNYPLPDVESVQDLVEAKLILGGYVKTAKAYILYREKRSELRRNRGVIPLPLKSLVEKSKKFFKNPLGEFIYYRTYARWIDEKNRRETWIETVDRYMDFMKENLGDKLSDQEYNEVQQAILNQDAMPSMRLLQFAGAAARTTNVCAYNCAFIAPVSIIDFSEILYVLMCGSGVGFSVEHATVSQLPRIKQQSGTQLPTHSIADSREGWADALKIGMQAWYDGADIDFDYSLLRPSGARLKTMGGKSSGPEPLRQLLKFTRGVILAHQNEQLTPLNVHDIICKIGDCVVSGGVRRSALISLSDLDDINMRDAKKGHFYVAEPQRSLANNSAIYEEKPSAAQFLSEWLALMESGSGERGILNRSAFNHTLPERRLREKDGKKIKWGCNPCGEIILRSKQFCNLSEVVAREEDTQETLLNKVRIATIIGTYQASLTYFPYLSDTWRINCQEERLLGVSLTGQWDCELIRQPETLRALKEHTIQVNKTYSERFGISESTSITCVKPSGTLSQLVDCSSGMHPRHAPFYIRRVRIAATDALFKMLKDQGVPYHPEVGQDPTSATTYVLEFPIKAPQGAIFRDDISALEQLEHWKVVKQEFTEHNPSVTISVGNDEWIDVAHWLYNNWDIIGGLSFLPRFDHVYQLAPYEAITEDRYNELIKRFEHVDFSKIVTYEHENDIDVKRELACVAGQCDW